MGAKGQKQGLTRECGWCGEPQTAAADRKHFTACPKRPTELAQADASVTTASGERPSPATTGDLEADRVWSETLKAKFGIHVRGGLRSAPTVRKFRGPIPKPGQIKGR